MGDIVGVLIQYGPPWWVAALALSVLSAAFLLINQQAQQSARHLMYWRGWGQAALFFPVALLVPWPWVPEFYLAVMAVGVLVAYSDRAALAASAQFGAGPTSRLLVLGVWSAFMFWLLLHPADIQHYLGMDGLGVVFALLGCMAGIGFLRRDPISRAAALFLLPLLLVNGAIDALNKEAMMAIPYASAVVLYPFLCALGIAVTTLCFDGWRRQIPKLAELFTPAMRRAGIAYAAVIALIVLVKNYAMLLAPNPAYVSALVLATPLWVYVFNRWRGINDHSHPLAGVIFICSALALIWFRV